VNECRFGNYINLQQHFPACFSPDSTGDISYFHYKCCLPGIVRCPLKLIAALRVIHCMQEAAKREVLEESGLTYDPTTLIYVEAPSYHWLRFTFTGTVTGMRFCGIKPFCKLEPKLILTGFFAVLVNLTDVRYCCLLISRFCLPLENCEITGTEMLIKGFTVSRPCCNSVKWKQ